jgi:hypothetical protein
MNSMVFWFVMSFSTVKPTGTLSLLLVGLVLGLLFDPEDGGHTFLRNIDGLLLNYIALQTVRP